MAKKIESLENAMETLEEIVVNQLVLGEVLRNEFE